MSDRLNRLNRSTLRPGLQARQKANRRPDSAQNSPLPNDHPPALPVGGRAAPVSRNVAVIRRIFPSTMADLRHPAAGALVFEGDWQQAYDPTKSSAQVWGIGLMILIALVWGAGFLVGFQVAVAIFMSIGLILAVVGLFSPSLGILAIGMLAAVDSLANIFLLTGGLLRYNTINYWLLIVMALFIPFILRLRDFNSRMLQIFLVLLALEITFSKDISRGVQDVLNMGVTFGLVVYFARALQDEISLYWMGLVNGLLASLGGLIFFLKASELPYANPNDWSYFHLTALFSICMAYQLAVKYHKDRILLLAFAAINFAWVFLSGSRGSLLVATLCGAYLFLATRSLTWKSVMVVMVFLLGVWVTANFVDQQAYMVSRIQMMFDPTIPEAKRTSKRSVIAEAGLQIFKENTFGIGTGSFEREAERANLLASSRPAHSAWIKVLAENGVPGIVLMVLFIGSFAIVGFRRPQEGRLLFALFITLTLVSAFIAKEFRGKSLWFLVAGGIAMLHPEEMLALVHSKLKQTGFDYRQRLREVRYGRKR